jgi:hypothetical protein
MIAAAGALTVSLAPATAQTPDDELLPDLRGMPAEDLRIDTAGGVRDLRLTTSIANGGAGAFEIFPEQTEGGDCDGDGNSDDDKLAYQRIFNDVDDDGEFDRAVDIGYTTRLAGCMRFHPAHNHWHFEDLASFELRVPGTDEVVASTSKVGFCLLDIWPFDPALGGHPAGGYYEGNCSPTATIGISVGWADTYLSGLPGQEIDIRNIPDGHYCLTVTGDPSDLVMEANEANNRAESLVTLSGNRVSDSGRSCDLGSIVGRAGDVKVSVPRAKCRKSAKREAKKGSKKKRRCRSR